MVCRGVLDPPKPQKRPGRPKNISTYELIVISSKLTKLVNMSNKKNTVNVSFSNVLSTWYKSK